MAISDKDMTCRDCGAAFVFTVGEQEFFVSKGFTNEPTRCPACRSSRRNQQGGSGGGYDRGPRGRCIRRFARSVASTPQFLSGQLGTNPYTAVTVSVKCGGRTGRA